MKEVDVYQFYNDKVKVLYSEIEARNNVLPVELLFEINSAFDHLKRIHIDGARENEEASKAFAHLKRGILDAFKLKLKYFNDDCKKLLGKKTDLRIIDNGTFLTGLFSARNQIVIKARNARLHEGQKDVEAAISEWSEVSLLIDDVETKYFDSSKITWATKQSFLRFGISFFVGIITGIISSVIVWFITK